MRFERAVEGWKMKYKRYIDALTAERDDAKYIPGQFVCPKCKFFLVSQTLYMKSGNVGPNRKPTECANGCGPMWRVSWQDGLRDMMDRVDKLHTERDTLRERVGRLRRNLEAISTGCTGRATDSCEYADMALAADDERESPEINAP